MEITLLLAAVFIGRISGCSSQNDFVSTASDTNHSDRVLNKTITAPLEISVTVSNVTQNPSNVTITVTNETTTESRYISFLNETSEYVPATNISTTTTTTTTAAPTYATAQSMEQILANTSVITTTETTNATAQSVEEKTVANMATAMTINATTQSVFNMSTTTSTAVNGTARSLMATVGNISVIAGDRTTDNPTNINLTTSAALFSDSSDGQITQTTIFTTTASPASPSTAEEGLPEDHTEQLGMEHTDGYQQYTGSSPENVTQNIISSNVSQNMTTDKHEVTTTRYTGSNYTNELQTAMDNFFDGNTTTTAGGLNNSRSLPDNTADFNNAATAEYIINNSTMEKETLATPTESGNVPSQPFQSTTFQGTSQMPDIVNSTSSQIENNSTILYKTNGTANISTTLFNNSASFPVTSGGALNSSDKSFFTDSVLNSTFETNSTTQSPVTESTWTTIGNNRESLVPSTNGWDIISAYPSTKVPHAELTTESSTNSVSIRDIFTTEPSPPWDGVTSAGPTVGGLPDGTITDGQTGQKSDAVAVAIGVIVGLLLVAALIIIFMLVRRKVVHGDKRKHLKDEENVSDFHVDLRPAPTKPHRTLPRISDITPSRQRNGTVRPPGPEVHDNIALDGYSVPTNKNYFQDGLESEAIKEALEDLKDYQMGGAGSAVKMRDKPAYPMRAISSKSRISVGPVLMEDEDPSTQNIYDKVYTHNTFKHGK